MATMQELRQEAKAAGVSVSEIRSAESAEELQGMIAGYGLPKSPTKKKKGSVMVRKAVKKSATKKAATPVKRGRGRPPGSKNKPKATNEIKRGPGRPKGSTNKVAASAPKKRGRPPGVKNKTATKTVAKRTTRKTAISSSKHSRNVSSTDGRHVLEAIDYSDTEGWNPRQDSAPDVILNALRRHKGNREKVFDTLKDRVWEFVGKKLRNGNKRTLASAHVMLRYRIARTDWDFAMKTDQHEIATDRAEYGSGGTGKGIWKPAKKKVATAPKRRGRPPGKKTTAATKTVAKRRGRPPGSKNRITATKTKTVAKRRGRPPGSKNRPK